MQIPISGTKLELKIENLIVLKCVGTHNNKDKISTD
jgi:hypothetical protein